LSDVCRHIAPPEEADTAFEGESRIARLARGRHLGSLRRTLAVRHKQELCGAGLMVGNEWRHPRRGDMQTSRRQILQCRGKIAVAHRHHLNSGALLQREHDVIGQARRGSPIELAWLPTGYTRDPRATPLLRSRTRQRRESYPIVAQEEPGLQRDRRAAAHVSADLW